MSLEQNGTHVYSSGVQSVLLKRFEKKAIWINGFPKYSQDGESERHAHSFKEQLDDLGVSPTAVAKYSGISRASVTGWYHGKPIPAALRETLCLHPPEIKALAKYWQISVHDAVRVTVTNARMHRAPRTGRPVTPVHSIKEDRRSTEHFGDLKRAKRRSTDDRSRS